jgi:dienelactone hydrolase
VLAVATVPFFATPALAGPSDAASPVASGSDWSVAHVPGGYQVTKKLTSPVALQDNAPDLWIDGTDIGVAQQSLDGLTLTVTTSNAIAKSAKRVSQGWEGQGDPAAPQQAQIPLDKLKSLAKSLGQPKPTTATTLTGADDPSTLGQYSVARDDYNLGDEVETLAGFGGRKGEMRGAVFMPVGAPGELPIVVFLHGRHTACYSVPGSGATANPAAWPCGPGQVTIPSYLGYNDAATNLASHGYAVVSISADAINALDGTLSDDGGAVARGQLVLDTLTLLQQANAGTAPAGVSLALKGRLDLTRVGLMGHSRGGEGVVRAALMNTQLPHPFGIDAVLPLAPIDFNKLTLPDVPTAVIMGYCDGDVSDLQGQHFVDDSSHAFSGSDNVLRSAVVVMGADHDYFNSTWDNFKYPYAAADDWHAPTDPVCGYGTTQSTPFAASRLVDTAEYNVGTAYISAFFRMTMGGEQKFMPMFDGSGVEPASVGAAVVKTTATLPSSERADVADFSAPDSSIVTTGAATAGVCASMSARPVAGTLPYCASALAKGQLPHWTPASYAPSVPSTPTLHFQWTAASGEVTVPVPATDRNVSAYSSLVVKAAPDENVAYGGGTDLNITVQDGAGGSVTIPVSSLGDALSVLPGVAPTTLLRKVMLQQVTIPVSKLAGLNLKDITQVRFAANTPSGGVYLSDLAFVKSATIGKADISNRPIVSVGDVNVEEGNGPGTAYVPVTLSKPSAQSVSTWFSALGAATSTVDLALQKVVFAPGQTCVAVPVPLNGNTTSSTTATSMFKVSVSDMQNSTAGDNIGEIVVREDDGVVQPAPAAGVTPPVGTPAPGTPVASAPQFGAQGNPCAEATAKSGRLKISAGTPTSGAQVTVTGSGYRDGEAVDLKLGAIDLGSVVSAKGSVTFSVTIPAGTAPGKYDLVATGAGSLHLDSDSITVKAPTSL